MISQDNIRSHIADIIGSEGKDCSYIVLGRDAYFMLKESLNIPPYEEIAIYAGYLIHITPDGGSEIKFI